jgi:hypothetical protein
MVMDFNYGRSHAWAELQNENFMCDSCSNPIGILKAYEKVGNVGEIGGKLRSSAVERKRLTLFPNRKW